MQAVILAAGRGNRMRPLTDKTHKTLLPIDGAPLIDHLLPGLESLGIRRVMVVTGDHAENVAGPAPVPLFRAAISLNVQGNIMVDKSQRENQPGKRDKPPFFLPLPPAGRGTA